MFFLQKIEGRKSILSFRSEILLHAWYYHRDKRYKDPLLVTPMPRHGSRMSCRTASGIAFIITYLFVHNFRDNPLKYNAISLYLVARDEKLVHLKETCTRTVAGRASVSTTANDTTADNSVPRASASTTA
jgi:hypothetical protein